MGGGGLLVACANDSRFLREIFLLMPSSCVISHVYRETNQRTDFLANWGAVMQTSYILDDSQSIPHKL